MKYLSLIILVLVTFFVGCNYIPLDAPYHEEPPPSIADLISCTRTIQTDYSVISYTTVPTPDAPDKIITVQKEFVKTATSYHIGGGYIVTAAHCVYFPVKRVRMPWGYVKVPLKTTGYIYTIDGDEVDLIGRVDDIALLFDPNAIGTKHISWLDSDTLAVGETVLLVGNSMMKGVNIKGGIVSMFSIREPVLGLPDRTANASFIMTNPTNGGDSGGPVFVLRDNKYLATGMCYAASIRAQGYNLAFKSNYILSVLDEIRANAVVR